MVAPISIRYGVSFVIKPFDTATVNEEIKNNYLNMVGVQKNCFSFNLI